MTSSRQIMIQFFAIMLLVSACGGQEEALPTEVEFPTDVLPTVDEVEAQVEEEPTETPTPVVNPTLPPTWTFTPEPSETPIPTATEILETSTPLPTPKTLSAACNTFGADPERSTRQFVVGEAPVAAWTDVEGAELYRVFLSSFSQTLIRDDIYTDQTSFTFDPNSFELGEIYVWAVWPLDSIGDQMCFERGGELIPQRPPINAGNNSGG